jgi:WD40 repeat protein
MPRRRCPQQGRPQTRDAGASSAQRTVSLPQGRFISVTSLLCRPAPSCDCAEPFAWLATLLAAFFVLAQGSAGMRPGSRAGEPTVPARAPRGEFSAPDEHYVFGYIRFTPDGRSLIAACARKKLDRREVNIEEFPGAIAFWDVPSCELKAVVSQPSLPSALAFFPDGKRLLAAGWDRKMRILAAPKWGITQTFEHDPPRKTVECLAIFPDGQRFVTNNSTYLGPRLWNTSTLKATPLKGSKQQGRALALSRDGKRLAVAYAAPVTEIWDMDRLQVVGRVEREKGAFVTAKFSPDGKWIAGGSIGPGPDRPLVSLWDAATFKKHRDCRGASDNPRSITFTSDSKLLIGSSGDERNVPGKVCIWEVESGKLLYAFSPWVHGCQDHALSPDDRWLVTRGADSTLRLWDFAKIRREIGR